MNKPSNQLKGEDWVSDKTNRIYVRTGRFPEGVLIMGIEVDTWITSSRSRLIKEIEKKMEKYKCDFNWDYEKNKPKHKSYIAISDILNILKEMK